MDYSKAIDLEAAAWAKFFNVTDPVQIEDRRKVMRANVAVGFDKPLLPFMPERVQIPAYTDRWMMGDRYGEVTKIVTRGANYLDPYDPRGRTILVVKLDKSGKIVRVVADDCTPV